MKTKNWVLLSVSFVLVAGIILASCKKDEEPTTYSYRAAQDNSTAEAAFNRSYNQINKAAHQVGSKSTNDTIIGCPTLYITGSWPKTLTLDFGDSCVGDDGIVRKGKIISVVTGLYVDSGTVVTSTFDNFYEIINGSAHKIEATQVIKNLGHNNAGHPHFSVDVQNASITYSEGTIHWTSQRDNEWFAGYTSYMNPWDDEYSVTGSANGTDINGATFTVDITSPLYCQYCTSLFRWVITSGKLDIINSGYPTITVDYGTGTCDYTVYVTINGVTYTYVLA